MTSNRTLNRDTRIMLNNRIRGLTASKVATEIGVTEEQIKSACEGNPIEADAFDKIVMFIALY